MERVLTRVSITIDCARSWHSDCTRIVKFFEKALEISFKRADILAAKVHEQKFIHNGSVSVNLSYRQYARFQIFRHLEGLTSLVDFPKVLDFEEAEAEPEVQPVELRPNCHSAC